LLIAGGAAALLLLALSGEDRAVPVNEPDLPATPGSTRYRRVDAILPQLQTAAAQSGVPLGLLVGWIARESGGKLATKPQPGPGDTKLDERGYFQLMPAESAALGFDHQKLSTDPTYSINAGLALIGKYMGEVDKLGVAPKGSTYYWLLVKLAHTMGTGAMKKIVAAAQSQGAAKSWPDLRGYALAHDRELLSATKHSPAKWFPFVDDVYQTGAAFGFGQAAAVVGGGPVFKDIPDPLDCLLKRA
ncbi:MAG TPA: transglycosylase SLT domain-containing protein, partial [Gemmatimonadaceae bacterium]|nr:transglycosylase SLT domain-containing protein [Gemmatimonadaceae bacterium]